MSRFLSDYKPTPSIRDIRALMDDFCSKFNFSFITYFAKCVPMLDEGTFSLSNYPETWQDRYFANSYEKIDPVLRAAQKRLIPLDWRDLPEKEGVALEFFSDAWEHQVGRDGMSVPIRGQFGEFAVLTVNANAQTEQWSHFWKNATPDFMYTAFLFHKRVLHALGASNRQAPKLTRRESEVMRWAVEGKSAWETACLVGLSERTVHFYVRNVCTKFEVATKTQAVARVVREHLLEL